MKGSQVGPLRVQKRAHAAPAKRLACFGAPTICVKISCSFLIGKILCLRLGSCRRLTFHPVQKYMGR
jgi:hypothetical protein